MNLLPWFLRREHFEAPVSIKRRIRQKLCVEAVISGSTLTVRLKFDDEVFSESAVEIFSKTP